MLRPRCELAAKLIVPAVRALVAVRLVERYGMTQVEVARRLGTSQPAVSYYVHSKRGRALVEALTRDEVTQGLIDRLADLVYRGRSPEELHLVLCEICRRVRASGMLAQLARGRAIGRALAAELGGRPLKGSDE